MTNIEKKNIHVFKKCTKKNRCSADLIKLLLFLFAGVLKHKKLVRHMWLRVTLTDRWTVGSAYGRDVIS